MAMIGHKTESIYRRYSIVDQAMLEMGTSKLEALQQIQRGNRPVVVSMRKREGPSRALSIDFAVQSDTGCSYTAVRLCTADPGRPRLR